MSGDAVKSWLDQSCNSSRTRRRFGHAKSSRIRIEKCPKNTKIYSVFEENVAYTLTFRPKSAPIPYVFAHKSCIREFVRYRPTFWLVLSP